MDRLSELLARVLPKSPDDAIGATKLIALLRKAGLTTDELQDASLPARFSQLVSQGSSVIAKRDGRHGYYRRADQAVEVDITTTAPVTNLNETAVPAARNNQKEEKFRAIYMAWCNREGDLPVHIEHTRANHQ